MPGVELGLPGLELRLHRRQASRRLRPARGPHRAGPAGPRGPGVRRRAGPGRQRSARRRRRAGPGRRRAPCERRPAWSGRPWPLRGRQPAASGPRRAPCERRPASPGPDRAWSSRRRSSPAPRGASRPPRRVAPGRRRAWPCWRRSRPGRRPASPSPRRAASARRRGLPGPGDLRPAVGDLGRLGFALGLGRERIHDPVHPVDPRCLGDQRGDRRLLGVPERRAVGRVEDDRAAPACRVGEGGGQVVGHLGRRGAGDRDLAGGGTAATDECSGGDGEDRDPGRHDDEASSGGEPADPVQQLCHVSYSGRCWRGGSRARRSTHGHAVVD